MASKSHPLLFRVEHRLELSPDATASAIQRFESHERRRTSKRSTPSRAASSSSREKTKQRIQFSNAAARKSNLALLIGAAAQKIESQIAGSVAIERAGTLHRAVEVASRAAQPGDIVLLAPACASLTNLKITNTVAGVSSSLSSS